MTPQHKGAYSRVGFRKQISPDEILKQCNNCTTKVQQQCNHYNQIKQQHIVVCSFVDFSQHPFLVDVSGNASIRQLVMEASAEVTEELTEELDEASVDVS